jgi:hypothetical protein
MRSRTTVSSATRALVELRTSRYMHALIQVCGFINYLSLWHCKLLCMFIISSTICGLMCHSLYILICSWCTVITCPVLNGADLFCSWAIFLLPVCPRIIFCSVFIQSDSSFITVTIYIVFKRYCCFCFIFGWIPWNLF